MSWEAHDNYISPWISEDNLGDESTYPDYCSDSDNIFSPSQGESDDDAYEYDDTLDDDGSSDNSWADDDNDDYSVDYEPTLAPTSARKLL